ncbi:hypothetical protein DHODJN_04005 [Methylorubrum extorquens]
MLNGDGKSPNPPKPAEQIARTTLKIRFEVFLKDCRTEA